MALRPSNFFTTLANISVLYDRIKPEHYGKTGIAYQFHCTDETEQALNAFFVELKSRTARFGQMQRILSAGAYVDKPGEHGRGHAFDLDAIHWDRVQFIAKRQPLDKHVYLLVQALCHKYFGTVLDFNYNADHEDHLHIDIGRPIGFRESRSTTSFIQESINAIHGKRVGVDSEYGPGTDIAFREVLQSLGIGWVGTLSNWTEYLERTCDLAVEIVASTTSADLEHSAFVAADVPAGVTGFLASSVLGSAHADGGDDLRLLTATRPLVLNSSLAVVTTASPLKSRPDTGRIDPSYAPHQGWKVTNKLVTGKSHYFVEFDGQPAASVGYDFTFEGGFRGLARPAKGKGSLIYTPSEHEKKHGPWAHFIFPTSRCESEAEYLVINAWDAAGMTWGFFQLAAHTGKHLSVLLKDLLAALPDESDKFFPELKLGSQIGKADQPNTLFAVNGSSTLDLDVAAPPTDGLPSSNWYRGRLIQFFNQDRGKLQDDEVATAARWVAWLTTSTDARAVCVDNAVKLAKATVDEVHQLMLAEGGTQFQGIEAMPMSYVAAAMDVKHHGRRARDRGLSTNESIVDALRSADVLKAFSKIDVGWRLERSRRSINEIGAMNTHFNKMIYSAAKQTFIKVN